MTLTPRRRLVLIGALVVVWAIGRAGLSGVVNTSGASAFQRFWRSALSPDLSADFLSLTIEATATTAAFAVLGSALALLIGVAGALAISERAMGTGWLRRAAEVVATVPRAVHEILVALLLIQVLGFDPMVAVIAIGVPFGAVTAKVYADALDDADRSAYDGLRASGVGRLTAVAYGLVPLVRGEFVSYAFYRFECAIRSAAVLGIVGVGGLGFQLDISFESLRYDEIWTLIFALMLLSGTADAVSSWVRGPSGPSDGGRWFPVVAAVGVAWSWWQVGLDVSVLWSARTLERGPELLRDLFPPELGPGGWTELWSATVDTMSLVVVAVVVAALFGFVGAAVVRRPVIDKRSGLSAVGDGFRIVVGRLVLLTARAVPAPVWAFLFVLVLYPGIWPGAVALGVYNAGVLGRLYAEAIESQPPEPERAAALAGAGRWTRWAYGVIPGAAPRLVSLTVYRSEVMVRETIVIGVVGAGGLGQLLRDHLVARDFGAVMGVVIVLIVLAIAADALGRVIRRVLR
ncbi:PhnE/PtxC family ABC transporter permease [Ilumatobacter nonamiensis]|uniref:PhnE/PtxC family ABC transporter permease n=1 Tax=Ilumatobacter nonamiensis TaxID=467093 RepID=UPI00034C976B|nr:ABC transporter permease subunit [Ilumatobacter nonamiensis]